MSAPAARRIRPSLHELGDDLTRVSALRKCCSLISPFAWCGAYFVCAARDLWTCAVLCTVALSFVTYGSVSHDLVHRNLGLPRRLNDWLLTAIELLAFRSGTAYRLAHLHHHKRFPFEDDVEGEAAKMNLPAVLFEGIRFQFKILRWAWVNHPTHRRRLAGETWAISAGYVTSIALLHWTRVPAVYAALMTAGAWIIPLITSYLPHDPSAGDELHQTRMFRGRVLSAIALEHLYHLEHHLYPAVPHHNWPRLAKRLEPWLASQGISPVRLWF
jgi:beta-carotene hydroxylase